MYKNLHFEQTSDGWNRQHGLKSYCYCGIFIVEMADPRSTAQDWRSWWMYANAIRTPSRHNSFNNSDIRIFSLSLLIDMNGTQKWMGFVSKCIGRNDSAHFFRQLIRPTQSMKQNLSRRFYELDFRPGFNFYLSYSRFRLKCHSIQIRRNHSILWAFSDYRQPVHFVWKFATSRRFFPLFNELTHIKVILIQRILEKIHAIVWHGFSVAFLFVELFWHRWN